MTPHMIRALSAAEEAEPHRGLERTVAGWRSTHPRGALDYHPFQTVNRLIEGGYLQLWGKGKAAVAHITEGGKAALARWREGRA